MTFSRRPNIPCSPIDEMVISEKRPRYLLNLVSTSSNRSDEILISRLLQILLFRLPRLHPLEIDRQLHLHP